MTKLNLIQKDFQGAAVRAVNHPEHGELLHATDVFSILGYVNKAGASAEAKKLRVPAAELILLARTTHRDAVTGLPPVYSSASFLTRSGVNHVLMASDKPKAQEFREWLAGDVVNAIVDTGGYLLNEEARDTAKADTRTSVPLPEEIGGAYAALIEARRAELDARMGELKALEAAIAPHILAADYPPHEEI